MKAPKCAHVRSAVLEPASGGRISSRDLETHLEDCPDCSKFLERARLAAETLGQRRSAVIADAGFAARVVEALPEKAEDLFGSVALRVLPATLALSLVLGVWCWRTTGAPSTLLEASPTDDLIGWVLEEEGDES